MGAWVHPIYSLAHLGIVAWLVYTLRNSECREIRCAAAIAAITAAGLVYDNGLLAAGRFVGLGDTLKMLSHPRYVLHAVVTPMMIFAMVQIAGAAGIGFAQRRTVRVGAGALAMALIPIGVFEDLVGLRLYPACFQGIVRYSRSVAESALCSPEQAVVTSAGPGAASLLCVFTVLALGFMLWRQRGWPWSFLTGLVMFIAAALPPSRFGLLPGNGGEVIFVAGFAAAAARFARRRNQSA